jgi:dTDP-4-dehydrorhamnose 3,5-epimerase
VDPTSPSIPTIHGTCPAGLLLTPLRRLPNDKGDIVHGMRLGDPGHQPVGEAYFTHILPGMTKGWKQHRCMTLNLLVAAGEVAFHIHDESSRTGCSIHIGPKQPARLTVPPGLWVAFSCAGDAPGVVLNLASQPHDPDEAVNRPLQAFAIVAAASASLEPC